MRGYDAWVTREPDWRLPDEPWQYLLHCSFCGCWVSMKPENMVEQITHTKKDVCYGSGPQVEDFMMQHDECPHPSDFKHGKHEVDTYGGMTTYFRCKNCGGEAALSEY
jgi:hypothetical protein